MKINLHGCATTSPAVRRAIQQSDKSNKALARQYGITPATVKKWKNRDSVEDQSHRPKNMGTTLSKEQELLVVELRRTLLLSLDDLLFIARSTTNLAVQH